jgi:ABC-2 type transport system permease protein
VVALAIGAMIRSSVGTIAVVLTLMLVLPGIAGALPTSWQNGAVAYLPAPAGQAIIGQTRFAAPGAVLLAPWTGFAILCGYAVVAYIAAAIALTPCPAARHAIVVRPRAQR